MADTNNVYVMTKPGMLVFPKVLEPDAYRPKKGQPAAPDAKKSFSCGIALEPDHPDVNPLKILIKAVAQAEWPNLDINAAIKANVFNIPFKVGNTLLTQRIEVLKAEGKEDDHKYDFQKDKIIFNASTGEKFPPNLGVRVNGQAVDITPENKHLYKDAFYTGCLGVCAFNVKTYTISATNKGVKLYLASVFSFKSGARISIGGRTASETFKGVAGMAVEEDPTAGTVADVEIPF